MIFNFSNIKVSWKLAFLVVASVIGFCILLYISQYELRKNLIEEKKQRLKAVLETTISQLNYLNQTYPEKEAKVRAKGLIESIFFNGDHYVFVMAEDTTMLINTRLKQYIGQKNVAPHWQTLITEGLKPEGGVYRYPWEKKDGTKTEKMSFMHHFSPWGWVLGTGMPLDDVNREINTQLWTMGMSALGGVLVISFLGFVITRSVTRPLKSVVATMENVAAGNIQANIPVLGKDEFGWLAERTNYGINSIREALRESVESARIVSEAAMRISGSAEETSQLVTDQRDQLNQLATAMNEMSATVGEVASHAEATAKDTVSAIDEAQLGQNDVTQSIGSIKSLSEALEHAVQHVAQLNEGVMEISDVTSVISGISEQTNLLALNAAIEAARAGEQGRGFAVVADEVRNLASRTNTSTEDIQKTVDRLQKVAQGTAEMMEKSQALAGDSVTCSERCGSDITTIVEHIQHISDKTVQIASASEEQSAVAEEMNRNLSGANDAASEVSGTASLLAKESEKLADMSRHLDQALARFQL
nr:methyl-accepting chemotaxis protein [Vibrio aerogenes]